MKLRPQWGWGQEPAHVDPQLYLVSVFEVTLCEENAMYGCPEPAPPDTLSPSGSARDFPVTGTRAACQCGERQRDSPGVTPRGWAVAGVRP